MTASGIIAVVRKFKSTGNFSPRAVVKLPVSNDWHVRPILPLEREPTDGHFSPYVDTEVEHSSVIIEKILSRSAETPSWASGYQ